MEGGGGVIWQSLAVDRPNAGAASTSAWNERRKQSEREVCEGCRHLLLHHRVAR